MMNARYKIGEVYVSVVNIDRVINIVKQFVTQEIPKYICVGNVRTTVLAQKDKSYSDVVNNAALNLPDGMPLVWAGKLAKAKDINRVTGPDLLIELLKKKHGLRHFLLGDTQEVLEKIVDKYKDENGELQICGYYSPPFLPAEEMDIEGMANMIKESKADIIWIALGAPKQDIFASQLVRHLDKGIVIGVGAAFRFLVGEFSHPPKLFQKIGLEGFYWRFFKNPKAELKWYMHHVPAYLRLLGKLKFEANK